MKRKITLLGYDGKVKVDHKISSAHIRRQWEKITPPDNESGRVLYFPTVEVARAAGAKKITPRYEREH